MGIRGHLKDFGLDVSLIDRGAVDLFDGLVYKKDGDRILDNQQVAFFQGDSVLDLTDDSTPSQATLVSSGEYTAAKGADTVIPIAVYAQVTTVVAADSTAPVVTIEDGSGTNSGLTLTLTDGDAADDVAIAEVADGDAATPLDLIAEDLVATVTTAAADAGTATGECKVIVKCLLVK